MMKKNHGGTKYKLEANSLKIAGCKKCGHCKVSCPILKESRFFSSTNTGKTYEIRHKLACESDWLIHLATCRKCKGQYVGKSKTIFKKRHSNHKCEIKNPIGSLGHHYGGSSPCGYQDLSIQLIEQIEVKTLDFFSIMGTILATPNQSLCSKW